MANKPGGPVRRWMKDGILYAENDFCILTWAPTDDPSQIGQFGWYGPKQIGVEFMLRAQFDTICAEIKEGHDGTTTRS